MAASNPSAFDYEGTFDCAWAFLSRLPLSPLPSPPNTHTRPPALTPAPAFFSAGARKIVQREGGLALFDGVLSRVLLITPRLTIAVTCYEVVRDMIVTK